MSNVHHKAKRGIQSLLVRQVFLQVFTFAGGVVLARILDPADFGLFVITTFLVSALSLLADFGLAPALIQRKKEISDHDLQVGFTVRHHLIVVIMVVLWFVAPWLASFYPKAPEVLVWLVRAMAVSLYLEGWRSMSVLQLERHLKYSRVAVVEVVESLVYQIMAVTMAVLGYGVWALVCAVLARGFLGTLMMRRAAPWRVRFVYDRAVLTEILRFGIPFHLHKVVGNVRSWVTPTVVASLIGQQAVGFLMWASSNGRKPLALVQNVVRVSLPHFSRLQDEPEEVERILSQYVVYFLAISGVWVSVLTVAGYDLVELIYTEKWLPAVPALIVYSVLLNLNAVSWITKTALSGQGRVRFVMRVTIWTTVLAVALGIALVLQIGFIGVPIAEVTSMVLTTPWLVRGLGKGALRRIFGPALWVAAPVGAAILGGLSVLLLPMPLLARAVVGPAATLALYGGTLWLVAPSWLKDMVRRHAVGSRRKLQKLILPTFARSRG